LIMQTHGGRARSIEAGELKIDVAFIATPAATKEGDGSGVDGKNPCGVLGYPIPDMLYAKKKVVVTDTLVDKLTITDIKKEYIDYVLIVDSIGDSKGIVSGTTQVTFDPIGLKIAKDATQLLYELGVIKNGFSMQTGAGGTSLAVASFVREKMLQEGIKGKMASGGITSYFVSMLEEGLIEEIRDVQCFDLEAIQSYKKNEKHYLMSASKYANPYDEPVVNDLSFMILGATEIDLDFNVNVTTSSNGVIMGGSGGHSDAAYGAEIALVVAKTMNARIPIIKKVVTTITTPGSDIDCLVTERGIAINPKRKDLLEKLKMSKLNIVSIEELMNLTYQFTREPKPFEHKDRVVGLVEYRDGTIIDVLYQV
ncbi:MAG TPA: citrate lyase subunit alpha, partial [Bacilli bacterium]|nr:citrate lyase subunit alpha [Bacilli bacterium]